MAAQPDVVIAGFEETLPVKTTAITGDERVPVTATIGTSATEINLSSLIGGDSGAYITFEVRSGGPLYVGMNKAATSVTSLTNGTASLGRRILSTDPAKGFWVTKDLPFIEVISDVAGTAIMYYKSNPNRAARTNAVVVGH